MKRLMNYRIIIGAIIVLAFFVRLSLVNYGLPLWIIGDEPSLITGALKMMELKTLLPFLHQEELKATLYFPPYLSYLYLLPFSILLGIKYLLFGGPWDIFKNFLISDLSDFFIVARIINIILTTATVWLVYKAAKNIFKEELPAILSAYFLSFSILHIYSFFIIGDRRHFFSRLVYG